MRERLRTPSVLALAILTTTGCATQQSKVAAQLTSPINCATAPGDIRVLRNEKANLALRVAEGETAIYPATAVVGMITGDEDTRIKVPAGDYDARIDARIAEIRMTCGVD